MCPSGKRRWAKRAGAHREAKALTRASRAAPRHKNVQRVAEVVEYYHEECGGWHVFTRETRRRVA